MPLAGAGDDLRTAEIADHVSVGAEGSCTKGEALGPFDAADTLEALRSWLACGAPFIEAEGALSKPEGGQYGDRFPACAGADDEPTFEKVHERVISVSCAAAACHGAPVGAPIDLSSIEAAYDALLGTNDDARPECALSSLPYVTPGDPDRSYLMAKLGATSEPICGLSMPLGGPMLGAQELDLIERWIVAGAPGPGTD